MPYPRRQFQYAMPRQAAAVLEYDMNTRLSDGRIVDRSGSGYHGTPSQGCVAPGVFARGWQFDGVDDVLNCGDVTQLNAATAFTIECWVKPNAALLATNIVYAKYNTVNDDRIALYGTAGGALNYIEDDGTTYEASTAVVLRAGVWTHVVIVRDGALVGNVNRVKMFIDGAQVALAFVNNFPASTANLATYPLVLGARLSTGAGSAPVVAGNFRVWPTALSAAQVLSVYLEGAKLPTLHHSMQDVPVSLANMTAGFRVDESEWTVFGGEHKVTEDALRQRWLELIVGTGMASLQSDQVFGTWCFDWFMNASAEESYLAFVASNKDGHYSSASQVGYMLYHSTGIAGGAVRLYRLNGGSITLLLTSAFIPAGLKYSWTVTRTLSGLFTLYVLGGAYSSWTNVGSASDSTTTVSWFFCANFRNMVGEKISNLQFYRGGLDPTLGQLPR